MQMQFVYAIVVIADSSSLVSSVSSDDEDETDEPEDDVDDTETCILVGEY
jgi:hypothetical protein